MLDVRGEMGEEWQQEGVGEVWLQDAGEVPAEVGLVGGQEGEELQEEGEVAVSRKGI